jgi:hypothetical protein
MLVTRFYPLPLIIFHCVVRQLGRKSMDTTNLISLGGAILIALLALGAAAYCQGERRH